MQKNILPIIAIVIFAIILFLIGVTTAFQWGKDAQKQEDRESNRGYPSGYPADR